MRQYCRSEQGVLRFLCRLERGNHTGLRFRGILQVEEFDSAGQQAGFAHRCRECTPRRFANGGNQARAEIDVRRYDVMQLR